MKDKRQVGLDIIRTAAICSIMLVHMIGHTGVMVNNVRTATWTFYTFLKFFSNIGVSLFLLLTGYLQSSREFNKKHYTSIIPVLLSYAVISLICAVAESIVSDGKVNVFRMVVSIFDFEYGYGWYVELYIGLFLVIPFLNILYRNIDRKQKLWLIAIMSFLTFVPSACKYFIVNETAFEVVPDFFMNLYPVTLYFIGAYIAEYKPKPNKVKCMTVFFSVLILETALCYYYSDVEYAWWLFNNNASLTHVLVALSLFLTFYNISASPIISVPAKLIAKCSFEMYLLSYLTDNYCYGYLAMPVWIVIMVDFVMAFLGANIIRAVTVPVGNVLKKRILKNKEKRPDKSIAVN